MPIQHTVDFSRECRPARTRARCACGWCSDNYAAFADAQRAAEVHVRRAKHEDFDALLAKSSIGAAVADVKVRGIDAHLEDLECEMSKPHRRATKSQACCVLVAKGQKRHAKSCKFHPEHR